MNLNFNSKTIVSVCTLLSVVIMIVIFIILPTAHNIQKTTDETYRLRLYMEQRYQESLRSKVTKKKLENMKKNSLDFEKFLFKKDQTLTLIKILETVAVNNQINQKVKENNLDRIAPNKNINLKLEASGKYKDVLKYIYNLETLDYFINITNLRLTSSYDKNGQNNGNALVGLTLEIYVSQ